MKNKFYIAKSNLVSPSTLKTFGRFQISVLHIAKWSVQDGQAEVELRLFNFQGF